jgi:hypothetical protein
MPQIGIVHITTCQLRWQLQEVVRVLGFPARIASLNLASP